jgi:hypothetical protein
MPSLSIVTVTMNRTEHVLQTARHTARLGLHHEHLILDYGSTVPLRRADLPPDDRIRLIQVRNPSAKWWLTHSYNLAFALATGEHVLKLDADVLLSPQFADRILHTLEQTRAHLLCNRLTRQDWILPESRFTTNGLFLVRRSSLASIRGFNPYLQNWGWDDIDLYSRLFLAGFPVGQLPREGVELIVHGDEQRVSGQLHRPWRERLLTRASTREDVSRRRMHANDVKNQRIAVAAILRGISWPDFDVYQDAFRSTQGLPDLPPVSLFDPAEQRDLEHFLARTLLAPNHLGKLVFRVLARLGGGPYRGAALTRLLTKHHIDLSKIT